MDEERRRKLEAGREKLNSFRKKKNAQHPANEREIKKQRKNEDIGEILITPNKSVESNTVTAIPLFDESSANLTQFNLSDADSRFEIELMDKFLTVEDGLVTIKESEIKSKMEGCNKKLQEYHNALQHRNEVISQLSASLQRTIEHRDKLEAEAHNRDETIATEMKILKQQLHQATDLLRSQKGKNSISAHEMFEAKSRTILLAEANEAKDKAIEELTQRINEQTTGFNRKHSYFEREMDRLKNELARAVEQYQAHVEREKELGAAKDRLARELDHRVEELMRTQDLFHGKISEKDETIESLKVELAKLKMNEETSTLQFESRRAELDEQHGLHIGDMKSQIKREHEAIVLQFADELDATRRERDRARSQVQELQLLSKEAPRVTNFDEMMFEIAQLKNENKRLKDADLESGDHVGRLTKETHLWKAKLEELAKEKVELEVELNGLRRLGIPATDADRIHEECARRVKLLETELNEAAACKSKCDALECEKNASNERYMNQINALEKTKLDLELKVCELESRQRSMQKSECEIKNELLKLEQEKCIFPHSDYSGVNILVQQMSAAENNLTVMKFRLLEEEEIKSALGEQVAHLTDRCERYERRQNEARIEIDALQDELRIAWGKHENTLRELENVRSNLTDGKGRERSSNRDCESDDFSDQLRAVEERFLQENALLKKCLDEEKARRQSLVFESGQRLDSDEKLRILMDSNRELLEERDDMLRQIQSQEEVLMQMANVDSLGQFEQQLAELSRRRKTLVDKLQLRNENRTRVRDVVDERSIFEEALRRDKEALERNMKEKEEVETQLVGHKVELERLRFEKRHLEELLLHKDQMENELKRQRRSLEDDLAELEHQLRDREDFIRHEKTQLEMEMRKKEIALRKWRTDFKEKQVEFDRLHSSLQASQDDRSLRMRVQLQRDSLQKIEEIRSRMSSHHSQAMNRLRKEIEDEFTVREGRLVASHAIQMSQFCTEKAQQLKLQLLADNLPQGAENCSLVDELQRARARAEEKLMEDVDRNEKTCLEDVRQIVEKLSRREMEIVCSEINMEMARRQQHLKAALHDEMESVRLRAQGDKLTELSQLREDLNKQHKNHVNQLIQTFQSQIDSLEKEKSEQIAQLIGEGELTRESLMTRLRVETEKEYQRQIQSFTQHWESEYLQRLADLRKEIEAKFAEATTTPSSSHDDNAKQTSRASFASVEKMLDQREELINKVTELRENLEKVQMAETKILKETLQTEFNAVIEIQTEMKRTLEANQSPVLIELKKVKEDYEKLQEKYEEITSEVVKITEEPLRGDDATGDRIVYTKTTPLAGAGSRVHEESSVDKEAVDEFGGVGVGVGVVLEEELNKLRAKLEEKHVADMEQLRIYFEKRCEAMEMKYEEEVAKVKASEESGGGDEKEFLLRTPTLTHFCDTWHVLEEPNVMELEEHYRAELDEKLQQYRSQLEEVRKQLETKHEREMSSLRREAQETATREAQDASAELVAKYGQEIERITSRHEEEIEAIKSKYAQDLAKETTRVRLECTEHLAKEMDAETEKLREQLTSEHEKQMEIMHVRLEAEKAREINDAVNKLAATLTAGDYETKLADTERACDDKCGALEDELAKLGALHSEAAARCEREHRVAVEALREQCQEELRELSAKWQDKMHELEKSCRKQVAEIEEEKARVQQQHALELDRLKTHYEQRLVEEKDKWQEEVTADNVDRFEEIAQQLDSDHQLELETRHSLIREHEEKIEQLQHDMVVKEKEFEVLLAELKESHERDVLDVEEEAKRRMAAELKRVRVEMDNLNEEKLQAVALDTESSKVELEDVHRKEIIELQKKMSKKHQDEMEMEVSKVINEAEEEKKRKLEDEMEKKVRLLRDEMEENNRAALAKVHEECVAEKENELKALRNHFDEEVARVTCQLTNTNGFKEPEEEQPGDTLELEPADVINRRARENEETDKLIALLQQRLDKLQVERDDLDIKFETAKHVLSSVVQTYAKIEMIINRQLSAIANTDVSDNNGSPTKEFNLEDEQLTVDTSVLSFLSEDGFELDLSAKISEMTTSQSGLDVCNDEIVASIGTNLQLAVTRLLQILTVTVHQCHESKLAQMELINTATTHGEEAATLSARCADLELQLTAEVENRERLALEIHKTIGLMENYKTEKSKLEEEVSEQEKARENVESELLEARSRIGEMEERMAEETSRLNHQRALISEGLSSHEQVSTAKSDAGTDSERGIIQENAQLHTKHHDLQLQSEKDRHGLTKRIQELEVQLEEQTNQSEQQLENQRQQIEDFQQQVEALEKQLRADKKYFDAQAAEYEQEREELQREVNNLQNSVRDKDRQRGSEDRLSHELESLAIQLQATTDTHEETLHEKTQVEGELEKLVEQMKDWQEILKNLEFQLDEKTRAERELVEQVKNLENQLKRTSQREEELTNELEVFRSSSATDEMSGHVQFLEDQLELRSRELDKCRNSQNFLQEFRGQIRNLEIKVEKKTRDLEALQLSASSLGSPSSEDLSLRDQLDALRSMQTDDNARSESPAWFDEMKRLEEKLEALSRAEEVAIKKTRDLEMSLHKRKELQEELLQDKEALQQQVNSQLLQISALQARIEEWRHNIDNTLVIERMARLQECANNDRELLDKKEKEIEDLHEQLEQIQSDLVSRETEVVELKLKSQPPKTKDNHQWSKINEENARLKHELKSLRAQFECISMPAFAQALLDEKNQEIDHLTQQLDEMQTTLDEFRCHQAGDAATMEAQKMVRKMITAEGRVIHTVNEMQELYDILKLAQNVDLEALQQKLSEKEDEIKRLDLLLTASQEELSALQKKSDVVEKEAELKRTVELAEQRKREVDSLRGVLKEKETLLEQVETLQGEVTNLTDFQTKLQEDYDTVQSMLEDTQKDLIKLQQQIKANDTSHQLEKSKLRTEVCESTRLLESKDGEIASLKERLDLLAKNSAVRHDELGKEISSLREQLIESQDSIEMTRRRNEDSNVSAFNMFDTPESATKTPRVNAETEVLHELERRKLEIENLVREKEELNGKLQALLLKNEDLTKRHEKAARANKSVVPVSAEVKKLQQMVQEMKRQIEDQKKEFSKNSQELQKAKTRQSTLEHELAEIPELKSQLQQTREKAESRGSEAENLKTINGKLASDLQKSHEEMALMNDTCRHKEESIKKLELEIERLKRNETEHETRNKELAAQEQELLEANNLVQTSEIERLRDETEQYQQDLDTLHSLLNIEKEEVERLKEQHKRELSDAHDRYKTKLETQSPRSSSETATDYVVPDRMQSLIQRVHKEGVQVLSLSELLLLKSFNGRSPEQITERWTLHQAWENEKKQLMAEIVALKDLLTQATETTGQATAELSNLLLQAVSTVFQKEKEAMVAELRTHILASNRSTPDDVSRLERRIDAMSENQNLVVLRMQQLLREPQTLVRQDDAQQLTLERMQHLKDKESFLKQITTLESDLTRRERHFKKQIDLSEYHTKQKEMLTEDLRMSLDMEKKRTLDLSSQLSYEKGINADLDTALTITRSDLAKVQVAYDRDKREIKSLTAACESEKFRSQALLQALECEQSSFSQLQEAMEAEKRRCKSSLERQQQIIQELQKSLEVSKSHQVKTMAALDQERVNHGNTRQQLEQIENKTSRISRQQPSIDENQLNRNADLVATLERERRRVVEISNALSQERATAIADLEREQALVHQLNKKLDRALEQNQELKRNLQREIERAAYMEAESMQLRTQHASDREREMNKDAEWELKRQLERERHREEELKHELERQRLRDLELEVQKLTQKTKCLERELEHARQSEAQLQKDLDNEQQKTSASFLATEISPPRCADNNFSRPYDTHLIETAKQQFHCFLFQCQQDLDFIVQQLGVDSDVVEKITRVFKSFKRNIGLIRTDFAPPPESGDDNRLQHFLEQVIRQNDEIVGFVIQLCEDKMELRRTQMTLEEEIVQTRQKLMSAEQVLCRPSGVTGDALSIERMAWAQERAALQLALHKAEAETLQLKSSMQFSASLNGSRENLSMRNEQQKFNDKIRRLNMRYLRTESFRKALVYQKKYLLVVLGGFQESEAVTLAMMSRIGVPGTVLESRMPRHQFALMKFRSAARVVVAICRMKYLVRRWHPHLPNAAFSYGSPSPHAAGNCEIRCPSSTSQAPSASSPDEHFRIHRLGATPPVRDLRTRSCLSAHSLGDRTMSSSSAAAAKKCLAASISASCGDGKDVDILSRLRSDRSLEKYLDRLESIQHNFGIPSKSRSPASSAGESS